jgi:hypothetical protein
MSVDHWARGKRRSGVVEMRDVCAPLCVGAPLFDCLTVHAEHHG